MKRIEVYVGVLAALMLTAGCVSVQRTGRVAPKGTTIQGTAGTPDEHVHVSNFGYYLFNCIPIFCGNTAQDHRGNTIWFSNEVTLDKTQDIMLDEVRSRKSQIAALQPQVKSTCFFGAIPYVGTTFGILWYKEVQMSAMLVRPQAAKGNTK